MANYLATDTDLTTVANAIRSKGNTSAGLAFPTGMKNAIDALNVGTGLSPAAGAADIRNGKKAVVDRTTITGSMTEKAAATYTPTESAQEIAAGQYLAGKQTISAIPSTYVGSGVTKKAAATYNTSSSDQSIAANQYLNGAQTIKAVTTENISAGNIKSGVTVKVGDANNAGRIKNVTGTYGPVEQTYYLYIKTSYTYGGTIGRQYGITFFFSDSSSSFSVAHKPFAIKNLMFTTFLVSRGFDLEDVLVDTNLGSVTINIIDRVGDSWGLEVGSYGTAKGYYMA